MSVTNKAGTNILQVACSEGNRRGGNVLRERRRRCLQPLTATRPRAPRHPGTRPASRRDCHARRPCDQKSEKRKLELVAVGLILGLGLASEPPSCAIASTIGSGIEPISRVRLNAPVLSDIPAIRGTLRAARSERQPCSAVTAGRGLPPSASSHRPADRLDR